jgi:hypothetical protein
VEPEQITFGKQKICSTLFYYSEAIFLDVEKIIDEKIAMSIYHCPRFLPTEIEMFFSTTHLLQKNVETRDATNDNVHDKY